MPMYLYIMYIYELTNRIKGVGAISVDFGTII
jgi:hypothetical protein